jgi:hypothetical protein
LEQHDRTFLEITHVLLWITLLALSCIGAGRLAEVLKPMLGGEASTPLLASLLVGSGAAWLYPIASRGLYRLNGFKVDTGHGARLRSSALALLGLTLAFGGALMGVAAIAKR